MKNIKEIENLKGKKILLRVDLNVPIRGGEIINDFRIKKIIPTINYLQEKQAKIIVLSHIGRDRENGFKEVFDYLKKEIKNISFCCDVLSSDADDQVSEMKNGDVVVMENLRQHEEERKNDEGFSKQIARLGDIYVNEAFSNSHRKHSSMVGITKFLPSYSGILFQEEMKKLSIGFNPPKPALFVLGGNKLKTKISFIKYALKKGDFVFVGGALANNFFKTKGFEVGKSFVVEDGGFGLEELMKNNKLILPIDVIVQKEDCNTEVKDPKDVLPSEKIVDAGPKTLNTLIEKLDEAHFVLMNGPLGDYERGFGEPTGALIRAIAQSGDVSIVGGGDTTALINDLNIEKEFTFVSTGGGAMLEFLIEKTLPGIEALESSKF